MLKKLSLLTVLFALAIGFNSCSKDDDGGVESPESSSTLTINNIKAGKMLYTLCEISIYPSYLGGGKELALEAHFDYSDEGLMSLDVAVPSITSISQLEKGMELTDDIVVNKFYSATGAFTGRKNYEVLGGSAIVEKVSNSAVVVKFSNFEFLRELGNKEETFTVNGTVSYTIND